MPRLREFCADRRLTLVDIDLRWGVPAESTSETILRACLAEIDRARAANVNPFFVNMLGHRYGWVPQPADVPSSVALEYNWVPSVSVTHMEILQGAYRRSNPNALFLIRNDGYLPDIPTSFMPQFLEPKFLSGVALQALKTKIREKFGPTNQVRDYTVSVREVDTSVAGIPKVVFDGLEAFGDTIYDFVTKVIDRQYPAEALQDLTISDRLSMSHDYFMESETEVVLGRDEVVEKIISSYKESCPIVLLSERGVGKSAVVALAAKEATKRGHKVVFFSTQSKTGIAEFSSADIASFQLLLCLELGDESIVAQAKELRVEDTLEDEGCTKIKGIMESMFKDSSLRSAVSPSVPAIVFLDEYEKDSLQDILPVPIPPGISLVFSTSSSELPSKSAESGLPVTELTLSPVDMSVKASIVDKRLGMYNKRLHQTQLDLLLANPGTESLRWLYLACEELRVFGAFETVTEFIKTLPNSVLGLLEQNLTRNIAVAKNYGDGITHLMIKDTLLLCLFEDQGLREQEVLDLLAVRLQAEGVKRSDDNGLRVVAQGEWSIVVLFIKSFVRMVPQFDGSRLVYLSSKDSRDAVTEYFKAEEENTVRTYRKTLADYYESSSDEVRRLQSYPLQLIELNDLNRIIRFKKAEAFEFVPSNIRSRVVNYLRCKSRINQEIQPEKFCNGCSMKVASGKMRIQACYLCGTRVFTHQIHSKETPKLWGRESFVYRCRKHNNNAWLQNFMQKCAQCKTPLPKDPGFSNFAIKCNQCSLGDWPKNCRCCQLNMDEIEDGSTETAESND